ncbi:MAG TPA: hypothetical protein VES42_01105, partial [Pilimelia sp.]|nr:hypothetical protein [Pilimelia sp.]
MTRMRRFVGAGLPAAGFTVLAALALGQPVSAAPHTDRAPLGLSVLDGYALENATAGGAGGVGTANQAVLPVRLPVTVACNAIGVLGDARAACAGAVPSAEPSGSSDGYYGGGGRGNGGSGTATAGPGGDNG